jgi:hypothetical protein
MASARPLHHLRDFAMTPKRPGDPNELAIEPRCRDCAPYDVLKFRSHHQTLKASPAMAAGVSDKLWEVTDIVEMLEQ